MKNVAFILIVIIAIIIYQRGNIKDDTNSSVNQRPPVTVHGVVESNLSILGQSAYRLVNITDTTKVYYVIGRKNAPSVGETLSVSVQKQDLVVLNNDTLAVYLESGNEQ